MDTYPYADYDAMSNWMKRAQRRISQLQHRGRDLGYRTRLHRLVAEGFKLSAPKNSNLKTVMDFSFFDKINTAKE